MMEIHGDVGPADGYEIDKVVATKKTFKVCFLVLFYHLFIVYIYTFSSLTPCLQWVYWEINT